MSSYELRTPDGKAFSFNKEWVKLGRGRENDIIIMDETISRHHLNFFIKDEQLIVEDTGSQNGYAVNGKLLHEPCKLNPGDTLSIGRHLYKIALKGQHLDPPRPLAPPSLHHVPNVRLRQNSPTAHNANMSIPTQGHSRLTLYLTLFLAIGGVYYYLYEWKGSPNNRKIASVKTPSTAEKFQSLDSSSFRNEAYQKQNKNEIVSASRFREGLRDYENGLYQRALLLFQEAASLDPNHTEAAQYIVFSKEKIREDITKLQLEGMQAFENHHYGLAKLKMMQILTILSVKVPGFAKKVTIDQLARGRISQESFLLDLPCEQSGALEVCNKARELLQQARQNLGEEDVIE